MATSAPLFVARPIAILVRLGGATMMRLAVLADKAQIVRIDIGRGVATFRDSHRIARVWQSPRADTNRRAMATTQLTEEANLREPGAAVHIHRSVAEALDDGADVRGCEIEHVERGSA